jgi:membrane-bound lytic murein transglycosylase D
VSPGQLIVLHVPYGRAVPAEPGPVRIENVVATTRMRGGVSRIGTRVPEERTERSQRSPVREAKYEAKGGKGKSGRIVENSPVSPKVNRVSMTIGKPAAAAAAPKKAGKTEKKKK